jgi:hypothetical protein
VRDGTPADTGSGEVGSADACGPRGGDLISPGGAELVIEQLGWDGEDT